MRTPAPSRRRDDATRTVWRRLASPVLRPLAALTRWERQRAPRVVRRAVAYPGLVAVLAGVLVVAGAGIHVARFPDRAGTDPVDRAPAEQVGPTPSADIPAYIEARHELLAQLGGDEVVRAIVSFREFVALGDLPADEGIRVEELHLRLPPETEPRVVPADGADATLRELLADGRSELDAEIAGMEQMLTEDLGDPEAERQFEADLSHLRQVRASASDDAPVVFAAVVVATAADLRDLVGTSEVRLVDVAGPPDRTRDARLTGVQPDPERASTERGVAPDPAP